MSREQDNQVQNSTAKLKEKDFYMLLLKKTNKQTNICHLHANMLQMTYFLLQKEKKKFGYTAVNLG